MSDDFADDELPADNMAGLANGMIILTSVILITAIILINMASTDTYGAGLF